MADEDARSYGTGASPFVPPSPRPLIQRAVPVAEHLPAYRPRTFRRDLAAGLTVAALAVPSAMAYAELAGVTAVAGLYALLLPTLAYALLGSSRQLIVGPEGSLSALVAAAVLGMAAAGSAAATELAATLALLVGVCFLAAWLLRLGFLADYLSRPVLIGYIHGVAAVLVIGQLGKLLGIDVDAIDPIPQLVEVARDIGQVNGATLVVGAGSLAILLPLRFLAPRVPAAIIVVVGATAASAALGLADEGVAVVGDIPSGLPPLDVPSPSLGDTLELVPVALGLFLVAFGDGILTARSYAGRHDQHVDAAQELRAFGAANVAAGLTQAIPIGASGSRTAVNDGMGSRTQVSGLLAAAAVVLVLLFLTEPIADLPKAALAAAIVAAAVGLVDPQAWRELWAADRVEVTIAAVTAAGVLITGVLTAIVFAVGLSIVDVVRRSARPHDAVLGWVERLGRYADVSVHRDAVVTPGVVVYRLDDRLFFANARYFKARVREAVRGAPGPTRALVLDAEGMTHVDSAGLAALEDVASALRREGIALSVARLKHPVAEHLRAAGLTETIGEGRFHPTVRAAVRAA